MIKNFLNKIKQFLEFIIVSSIVKLARAFPCNKSSKFGGILFKKIGPKLKRSKIIKKNLEICNFEENLIPSIWENWGEAFFEVLNLKELLKKNSNRLEIVGGIKHKKAFYVSAHLGHVLVQNVALKKLGVSNLSQLYHPRKNKFIDNLFKKIHQDWARPIAKGDVKTLMSSLRGIDSLIVLLDQKEDRGERVSFFSKDAMTNVSLFKLAKKMKIPIVPIQVIKKGFLKYKVIIHDEIPPDMKILHNLFEDWIKQNPDQYFWFHNRWP